MLVRQLLSLLLFCAWFSPAVSLGAAPRVALLSDAQVRGATILLVDLIPAGVSSAVSSTASQVALGAAPQVGCSRRLSRDLVARAIHAAGLSVSSFLIPEFTTVRRVGSIPDRDKIFAAIQTALAKSDPSAVSDLRPQNLVFDSSIPLDAADTDLAVTQFLFDRLIGRAQFRLQAKASSAPPFWVTADLGSRARDISVAGPARNVRPIGNSAASKAQPLVDPRHTALLHLHSADSDMRLAVRPLEPGSLNQVIRVRLRDSGKTFRARVVAINAVDAAL